MHPNSTKIISNFYVAGINYRKTDAAVRGQFAISQEQYGSLLSNAREWNLDELFVLSTCNRTEVYGFAPQPSDLVDLVCQQTAGDRATFESLCYIKSGWEAVEHIFQVAAGLDSQILGDYEIVGQLKTSVKFAKEQGFTGAFLERLVNSVLQSSKNIKNQTQLSGGTVSVSFAAVQYIREHITAIHNKKILLLGVGKIGRNTGKNLADYLPGSSITLINRSPEKAMELAQEIGVQFAPIENLSQHLHEADIILVASNANEPVIVPAHLQGVKKQYIIDLSIPYNVDPSVGEIRGVKLVNVDELSKLKDETLHKREAEVPKAKAIIYQHRSEFMEWYEMRKHVPVLKAVKTKLRELHSDPLFLPLYSYPPAAAGYDDKIQRVINGMASKLKVVNQKGCHYIEAINEYIATGTI